MGIFRQFPYSNFHEMNMDEIIKILLQMQDEWNDTKEEWASYKEYIDNYFETLDLSEETYNALLRTIENGIFNETVDPVIISEVETWLNENINNGYVVDKTLSISGAAADAKVTGNNFKLKVNIPLDEHNQPYNGTNGQLLRTKGNGTTEWVDVGLPTDEQTAQAVSDWLDAHPEATTTVEDGAITFPKMGIGMNNCQIVKNITELRTSVAPYVYVINNDSKVSDIQSDHGEYFDDEPFSINRGGCWYWTHSNNLGGTERTEIYGGYLRDNGDVMFAMPDQGDRNVSTKELSSMFDTFASYFSAYDLIYGDEGTMFMEDCVADANGKFNIDCATLVSAIIQGIKKENSRYDLGNLAENIPSTYSAISLPSTRGQHCLYLNELVEYFAENKQLFTLHKPDDPRKAVEYNGLQVGDILFSGSPEAEGAEQARWNSYYAVDHISIVLGIYPEEGTILIGEGGGSGAAKFSYSVLANSDFGWLDDDPETEFLKAVKVDLVNLYTYLETKYLVFARPTYGANRAPVNISGYLRTYGNQTHTVANSSKLLAYIVPSAKVTRENGFTITVKGVLPKYDSEGAYMHAIVAYTDTNNVAKTYRYDFGYRVEGNGTSISFPFFLPDTSTIASINSISIYSSNYETTGQTYRVDEIAICNGADFFANGSKPLVFTKDSNFPNTVYNYSYIKNGKAFIYLAFDASGTSGVNTLGKFDNLVQNKTINSTRRFAGSIGQLDFASMGIDPDGNVTYSTNSTSTSLAVFIFELD